MPHPSGSSQLKLLRACIIFSFLIFSAIMVTPALGQMTSADIKALQDQAEAEGWTFTVGENPATQYPLEDLCGMKEPENWRETARFDPCTPSKNLPEMFDWREITGCPPVRNQRSCGSCWAFSTTGALECNIRIKDGEDVDLSEQWLVSCNHSGWGCDGGWYAHDYHMNKTDDCDDSGAVLEAHFPYSATDEPCLCPYPHKYYLEDWVFIGDENGVPSNDAMKQAIMDYGPISVALYVGSSFQAYNGGVFTACGAGPINHAVVLVGWDDTQGLEGVWFLRNSWGPGWGEGGYMRMKYNCPGLGTGANYVIYNRVQKIAMVGDEVIDDVGGDGDGSPEAGETVQFVISFENRYENDVNDVYANLFFDDAALNVTKGTAYLGNIPDGDTVTNSASPFEVEIPVDYIPRTDSMFIEFVWDGGASVDTQVVERIIGGIPILIVDDDRGDDIDTYYTDYLDAMRVPYDRIEQDGTPPDKSATLGDYPTVFWITGDYQNTPIDPYDIYTLQPFLSGGGKLFLSGQGIVSNLSEHAPDFLSNYLKAEYLYSNYIPVLGDRAEGQIFLPNDSIALIGGEGAGNQDILDQMTAINGGVPELGFINNPGLGALSYVGDYQLLFFSFGFEGIINGSYRWTPRDTMFARIIDFFSLQTPGVSPSVQNLAVTPGDPTHMVSHAPTFEWSYSDPGSQPQTMCQVQVTDDKFWMMSPIWDSGPVSASETQAFYTGGELFDGIDYYIRVRAFNGTYWSNWIYSEMHMNSVPIPMDLSPDNLESINGDHPELTHNSPDDNENDSLTFAYELYDDSTMTTKLAWSGPEKAGSAIWQVPMVLTSEEDYFWRARASDQLEDGQWSDLASFWVMGYVIGDANGDETVNVGDVVFVITYVFKGGPAPEPLEAGDANCDGQCNVADAVYLISYIFKGGPEPGCH